MRILTKHALAASLALVAASLVNAAPTSISGSFNGMTWTASQTIVGATSTQSGGPITNGGDPIYWPSYPRDSGVVALLMDYGPGGSFICSGTLLADRRSILTAAHCVSDGAGTANPLSTTVFFQPADGLAPGVRIHTPTGPGVVSRSVTNYFVNNAYTGDVIDQNDIAVLRLNDAAPDWARSYGLYTTNDLEGKDFTVHGYGRLGDGTNGANNFTARLRNGDNKYDYRLGNSLFGNGWAGILGEPLSQIEHSIVSDFDNGLAANDTSCRVAQASNLAGAAGAVFCDTGRGAREAGVAGGDSGGPGFIGDLISSVNSYGLTFGPDWGDLPLCTPRPGLPCTFLQSSFGEFSGYVPVWLHTDFIRNSMVSAPGTLALLFSGLMAPLFVARKRRSLKTN